MCRHWFYYSTGNLNLLYFEVTCLRCDGIQALTFCYLFLLFFRSLNGAVTLNNPEIIITLIILYQNGSKLQIGLMIVL